MEELKEIEEYLERVDPFEIPLDKYREIVNDESRSSMLHIIARRVYELYGEWVNEELRKRRAKCLLVCDKKVLASSGDRYGFSLKYIAEMEDRLGKPCFLLTGETFIEEGAEWSRLNGEDYYPTVEVYLGNIRWVDEEVFDKGIRVRSDFDTGNPEYAVFDEVACRTVAGGAEGIGYAQHLGRGYSYFFRRMKIGVKDWRIGRCLEKTVEGVDNWNNVELNPYRLANPNREGFVGRDLMLKLLFRITLDPVARRLTWELL